jgi:hypothetical protein
MRGQAALFPAPVLPPTQRMKYPGQNLGPKVSQNQSSLAFDQPQIPTPHIWTESTPPSILMISLSTIATTQ